MNKIALITGANKGIGLETARQLARVGDIHVILTARDPAKGAAAARTLTDEGLDVESLGLDVTDAASIAAAARSIEQRFGRLDILVNNAGISVRAGPARVSAEPLEAWRRTFDTNLFGLIAVTQAFLPLIKKAPAGRIVNLSSILGSITLQADPKSPIYNYKLATYDVSKSAVNAWTVHLAYELRDTPIKVNAAHPGHVKTDMGGDNAPLEVSEGAKTSVALALLGPDGPSGAFIHLGRPLPW
jgi:NAD(P)-dependent dehydrogenase (short-subunit alcohol dehydrogenase family)